MQNLTLTWRKGWLLSATFLVVLFVTIGCKKVDHKLGQDVLDDSDLLESGVIDTFSMYTSSYAVDSVIASVSANAIIGSCNDPVFGKVNSELYVQARLSGNSPNFGDLGLITVDSVVLSLEYTGMYGNPGNQTIEVYEIGGSEALSDTATYYRDQTFPEAGSNLVASGYDVYYLDPTRPTKIDTIYVDPQLRIRLDPSVAWQFFNEATNNPTSFESSENFIDYFKGFKIKTNNGNQSSGEGGLFYFDVVSSASKLNIYYKYDGVERVYEDIVFNGSSAYFNHVDFTPSAAVQSVINNPAMGQKQFYAQSYNSRAVVRIPGISNIPTNSIIHSAILELPVEYQTGQPFEPGLDIAVRMFSSFTDSTLVSNGTIGLYDVSAKKFTVDVRDYVQRIVTGELDNSGFVISPLLFSHSLDRIEFNGPETTNKEKPKFKIIYTEF